MNRSHRSRANPNQLGLMGIPTAPAAEAQPAAPAAQPVRRDADDFAAFNAANPHVYRDLERMALAMARAGRSRVSVKFLYEKLRESAVTRGDTYRLNNYWQPYYARLLRKNHPELRPLIRVRGGE